MNWKTSMLAFFAVIAGSCIIPFVQFDSEKQVEPEKPQQIYMVETNSIPESATNNMERGKAQTPNTSLFKDSSNYVWDGWKIK